MARDEKKAGFMEMIKSISGEQMMLKVHRGRLLRLLGNACTVVNPEDKQCNFFVRLPFSDYGDLTIDDCCLTYLEKVKENLVYEYHIDEWDSNDKKKSVIPEELYEHYLDYMAIKAVEDFLYTYA